MCGRLAREAQRDAFAWIAEAIQAQRHAQGRASVRAHADVRRHGAGLGVLARQLGRVGCHAAALHGAIKIDGPGGRTFPVSPLCGVPKDSHRRPAVGVFMMARTSLAELSAPEGTESVNRFQRAPRGHGGR